MPFGQSRAMWAVIKGGKKEDLGGINRDDLSVVLFGQVEREIGLADGRGP